MPRQAAFAAGFLLSAPVLALGQVTVPPGYREPVQLTNSPVFDHHARINNAGQIVWETRIDGTEESSEIFLWQNGQTTRLTNDNVRDAFPVISDTGAIVWTRFNGPIGERGPTGEIVLRDPDGTWRQITQNGEDDRNPALNGLGEVVWKRYMGTGCFGSQYMDIFHFDGQETSAVTTDAISDRVANQSPQINDSGTIVWMRMDPCGGPGNWDAKIMLRDGSGVHELTEQHRQPTNPIINNRGTIAWSYRLPPSFAVQGVAVWQDGANRLLTDWGVASDINDRGWVTIHRWHDEVQSWQVWLYREGQFIRLSDAPTWHFDANINQRGDLVWMTGSPFALDFDVLYLPRLNAGDLNCDGVLDAFDIEPFISALLDPAGYRGAFPKCDLMLADVNEDGTVDAFDIEPFVGLLTP